MPRPKRLEFEGGLYHVMTRGNNRQAIFKTDDDHHKFLALLVREKERHPFYLYAYVLMTNHIHLLVEQRVDRLSSIMQRQLTAYARYWNRKYRRVGHVFQGRYKAFLCQKDQYLSELVRYIHLNPVRAKLVQRPEDFRWSSHRAYLGIEHCTWLDSEPVLRHFGANRSRAIKVYRSFVDAGSPQGHRADLYDASSTQILGDTEFIEEVSHRIGESSVSRTKPASDAWDWATIERRLERVLGIEKTLYDHRGRTAAQVRARDMLIYLGKERTTLSNCELAHRLGIHPCNISRGYERARARMRRDSRFRRMIESILTEP